MMYSNRFIASIRVNGKILRENQGTVSLPFGAEYEILLKNMNSRRAMARVTSFSSIAGFRAAPDSLPPCAGSIITKGLGVGLDGGGG